MSKISPWEIVIFIYVLIVWIRLEMIDSSIQRKIDKIIKKIDKEG